MQLLPEENPALLAKEGGISLQRSPALGQGRLLLGEAQYRTLLEKGEVWAHVALPREGSPLRLLVYARRVEVNLSGAVWKGALLVGKPTEDLEATLNQFARIYAGTALLVLLLSLLLARGLVARAWSPWSGWPEGPRPCPSAPSPSPSPKAGTRWPPWSGP